MHRQRAAWETVPVRQPQAPWWANRPAEPPRRADFEPVRPLPAATAAKHILQDFVASGVDEDLERLRDAWRKPPTPPSSDDDEAAVFFAAPPRSRGGGPRVERPQWQGPLDSEMATQQASSGRKLAVDRVRGGALDFRAAQRLEMLSNLRRLANSGAAAPQSVPAMLMLRGPGSLTPSAHAGGSNARPTAIERETRRAMPVAAGSDPMSWDHWERRWAEELRAFASAAAEQEQLARLEMAVGGDAFDAPMRHPLRPRRHVQSQRVGTQRPPSWQGYPHETPPVDSDTDGDDEPTRTRPGAQRHHQHHHQQQHQQQQWWRPHQPPAPQPPPPSAPQRSLNVRTFANWAEYNSAFEAFEARLPTLEAVGLGDVPFPPSHDPAGFSTLGAHATSERKKLLRKALLRWHPDKWATVLPRVIAADRSVVADRLSVVTQAIVQQKKAL